MGSFLNRCLWLHLLFLLPFAGGCVTYRLNSETTSEEREMSIDRAYISPAGDLIVHGYLAQPDGRERLMVVSHATMVEAIARRRERNKEALPKVTFPFETEHRYLTTDPHDHTFADYDAKVLAGASPPIEFFLKGQKRELIPYDWQNDHAILETKGLLLGPLHFGRTGGQKIAFGLGLLPAVAVDVITSPLQLIAGVVLYVYYEDHFSNL